MEAYSDGAGYGNIKSVTALQRDHNYAVTSCIGQERREHLQRVLQGVNLFLAQTAKDSTIEMEQIEQANALKVQVQADLAATQDLPGVEDNSSY